MGVFGGTYFHQSIWRKDIDPKIFLHLPSYLYARSDQAYDARINFYQVRASQSQAAWEKAGWIHPQDPRGWFQWYSRFFSGRRTEDDARQIRRWRAIFRHQRALKSRIRKAGASLQQAAVLYPKACQAILHWGWVAHIDFDALPHLPSVPVK